MILYNRICFTIFYVHRINSKKLEKTWKKINGIQTE